MDGETDGRTYALRAYNKKLININFFTFRDLRLPAIQVVMDIFWASSLVFESCHLQVTNVLYPIFLYRNLCIHGMGWICLDKLVPEKGFAKFRGSVLVSVSKYFVVKAIQVSLVRHKMHTCIYSRTPYCPNSISCINTDDDGQVSF